MKPDHTLRISNTGKSTPVVVFALVLFCVGLICLTVWTMQPKYVVLSSQVVDTEHTSILKELNRRGIQTRTDVAQKTIWVQESALEPAQQILHGFVTDADENGLSTRLASANSHDLTANEAMLAKSIEMIRGIQSATVHLTPDKQSNSRSDAMRASVMVRVLPNSELSQEKVDSIASIVGAFQKIPVENVVISDNYGHLYRATPEEIRSVQNKMDFQRQTEKQHRQKLHNLLDSMVGAGKYSFVVNIDVNFLNRHSEKTEHKGDGFVIKQESSKGNSFVGGSTQTETVYNKTVTSEQQFQSDIKFITVAAFVELPVDASGKPSISKIEIEELIKTSIGYDPTRGDDVIVEVGKVATIEEKIETQSALTQSIDPPSSQAWSPIQYGGYALGGILIVVTGIILYRNWKTQATSPPEPPALSPEHQQQIHSISAAAENDPDLLGQIISNWAKAPDDHNRAA